MHVSRMIATAIVSTLLPKAPRTLSLGCVGPRGLLHSGFRVEGLGVGFGVSGFGV